jgi:DNA topoisomerase IV subunit A (EC 5.99.1.3)
MAKRFRIISKDLRLPGVTRDKDYDLTKGTAGSRIVYFSANPNGEAETVKVILKPKPRQKLLVFEKDFSSIAIKGRASMGNLLTKAEVHKITLKQKGSSTLGGRQVWFDRDVAPVKLRRQRRGFGRVPERRSDSGNLPEWRLLHHQF